MSDRKISDFDIWYKPCNNCWYDGGKSTLPGEGVKKCWKCGRPLTRDYSDRALKPSTHGSAS